MTIKKDINDVLQTEGVAAARTYHDQARVPTQQNGGKIRHAKIEAEPFVWRDPATIPRREWLFGHHYIRKNIGATIGGGGRAKTTLGLTEAISMACGRDLLKDKEAITPLRVWYLNGEEDQDELDRRVAAICSLHTIKEANCAGRLFVQSVRDKPMRFATLAAGNKAILNHELLNQFEAEIKAKQIDVFMLDPLISFHSVFESLNEHMDPLIKAGLGGIASRTNSAGEIFHHPGKPKPGMAETTVEDARGASAIIWAVRSARVLNFMSPDEATKLGIGEEQRRMHIRISNGKANMGPIGKAIWFKLEVEKLPNGDEIACGTSWKPPNPFAGVSATDMHKCRELARSGAYRASSQAKEWIGYMIADVLNIKVTYGADNDKKELNRIKQILDTWLKNKVFAIETRKDEHRKDKEFIVPGPWREHVEPPLTAEPEIDELDDAIEGAAEVAQGAARQQLEGPAFAALRHLRHPLKGVPGGGAARTRDENLRIIGEAPAESSCLQCHKNRNEPVMRIRDASVIGGKAETLHEACAGAWFKGAQQ
jgi:hypothetical protein